ncbi:MAG TPA: hypothetical protein VKS25_14455 [Solirubrobacteraceae bacterium]|nr:hypothetical protein [Solirubrobacteraceae bacterium]
MSAWSGLVRWGVIDAARTRQRRHRLGGAAAIFACALAVAIVAFDASRGAHPPAPTLRLSSSPTWLTGPPLGRTHLRLVASENGGPASIVDVDTGRVRPLPQLDVPRYPPALSLTPTRGGALAVVSHQACAHCALTNDDFLIGASGAVRLLGVRHFAAFAGTIERSWLPGTAAEWVLTWPHRGPCTLRLVPSSRSAVKVPCGDLGAEYADGIALWTDHDQVGIVVDPRTGAVRRHLAATNLRDDPVGHGFAVEGPSTGSGRLTLLNLISGKRRVLRWPSRLYFGYQLIPDPVGRFVAIEFVDPAYPGYSVPVGVSSRTVGQAADLWLLDERAGTLNHVPGFPILELLKQSGVAWTADGRLAVVARGGAFAQSATRTAIGVWRPGQRTLRVRALPPLNGYTQFVPLVG